MNKLTNHKGAFIITLITILVFYISSAYAIYNIALLHNIENIIRLCSALIIASLAILFIILAVKFLKKYKKGKLITIIILMLLISVIELYGGYNIGKVYNTIQKVSHHSDYITHSSSIVTLKDNKVDSIKEINNNEKLGILEDKSNIEGYIIPKEVIKKENLTNETQVYPSFISMIDDLKAGKINYIFLPTNYSIMFASIEGYENLKDETKIIYNGTKKIKKGTEVKKDTAPITSPFTILLMGVDSETEGIENSTFNGDSLMVVTFNPKTLSTTILSIPRDSYVPITCFANKKKNKITHAAWQGESCMEKTIENLLDVNIDYYVKINFKGVVELVDTLGGVEIDVPYALCEQNSDRAWGKNTIYIEKGLQKLNGEQALAFSRNRHPNPDKCAPKWTSYTSDDFVRGQNQQEVVMALLNKFKSINNLDQVNSLLKTISNNMNTNMSTSQILSLYNVFKDIAAKADENSDMADLLGIKRLYLNGYGQMIYDYGGINLPLYNYVLYDGSVKAVSNAMKVNLGLKKEEAIKSFSFDINTPYEEKIIGKTETSKSSITLLPNFVGKSVSYVNSFCGSHGIKVGVNGNGDGTVVSQSVPAGANVEDVNKINVSVAGGTSIKKTVDNSKNDNKTTNKATNKTDTSKQDPVVPNTPNTNNNDTSSNDASDKQNEKQPENPPEDTPTP